MFDGKHDHITTSLGYMDISRRRRYLVYVLKPKKIKFVTGSAVIPVKAGPGATRPSPSIVALTVTIATLSGAHPGEARVPKTVNLVLPVNPSPVTYPSFAAMVTGRTPAATRVDLNLCNVLRGVTDNVIGRVSSPVAIKHPYDYFEKTLKNRCTTDPNRGLEEVGSCGLTVPICEYKGELTSENIRNTNTDLAVDKDPPEAATKDDR